MSSEKPVIVSTTAETEAILLEIANRLVEDRLAACCQVSGPVQSVYRWQGNVENSLEFSCAIKTIQRLVPEVIRTIQQLHPYDTPELVVTEIVGGSASYLKWIAESVSAT